MQLRGSVAVRPTDAERSELSVGASIVEVIRGHGVRTAFCVPGESYLGTLDAFAEPGAPTLVAARHEEGAGIMAEAHAKATGQTGVALVTRGPGLTHLSIALHTAHQDSTPLVALVGQVPRDLRHREAFQELDIAAFGGACAKWAFEIPQAERAAELVDRAFRVAATGRQGPVVVGIPEDVDRAVAPVPRPRAGRCYRPVVGPEGVDAAAELIRDSASTCIVAGSGVLRAGASQRLVELAERIQAPVFTAWRRFDAVPNQHPLYMGGMPGMPAKLYGPLRDAELVIAVGTRLGEFTTLGYRVPADGQRLLHVDEAAEVAGAVWTGADVALVGDCGSAVDALCRVLQPRTDETRARKLRRWRARFERASTPRPPRGGDGVDLEGVYHHVRRLLPVDACTTCDAGTFSGWLARFYAWRLPGTQFAPTAGGMGYALPAAIGVKLARPESSVVAFAGDGGLAMTMSELETAVRCELGGLVVLVFDNESYGTIRRQQMAEFPNRAVAVDLCPFAFEDVAEAVGAAGQLIGSNSEFPEAFERALEAPVPTVLRIPLSRSRLDPWDDFELQGDD